MKTKRKSLLGLVATAGATAALVSSTPAITAHESFLPPNDLNLQDNMNFAANITQDEFNSIVDSIVDVYKPLAKAHGGNLKANKNWTDSTVNASANQLFWTWSVNMYGGLARRPEVTRDGFALVVCHELGHHFGGYPFVGGSGWAANEGQADYFATESCARKIWADQKEDNAAFRNQVDSYVKDRCDAIWKTEDEQNLCYRISVGGESLARLLAVLGQDSEPRYDTPDTKKVSKTDDQHPAAQCRLDTYLAGSLCAASFDSNIIPGRSNKKGEGSIQAEQDAAKYSCTASSNYSEGLRPACWFKARL